MKFYISMLIAYVVLQLFSVQHLVHGQTSGDVRINFETKLLEVFTDSWGYVCDDYWRQAASDTVCRQLGNRRAQNYSTSQTADSIDFKIDDVFCPNNQFYINDCEYETAEDCSKNEHVEVICEPDGCESLLQSVASISQTAYFYQDNQWQYICADNMTQQAADVICRSHTNTTAMSFTSISSDDTDYGFPIYGYRFNCTGSESSLCDCVNIENSCSSMEVVQITCYASENGVIRLTNEDNGLLQVFYDGKWGYICDDGWTYQSANETCKILGYERVLTSFTGYYVSDTTYLLNFIRCLSGVTAFLDCAYSIYTPGYCTSHEHIYISCRPNNQCESILQSAELELSELEYFNGTETFKVCADVFTTAEGEVVCRENTGTNLAYISSSIYNGTSNIYPDTFQCKGYEDSLCECPKMLEPCPTDAIVHVQCSPQENGNVRINDETGLVEVYIDGWGYVCDDYWDQAASDAVCRQLGHRRALISSTGHFYADSDYKIDDVMCPTNIFRINDCKYETTEDCSSFEHVAVICEPDGCESLLQSVASISQIAYFYQDNQWQYICADNMTQQAADVICRSHTNTTAMSFSSISSDDTDYDFPIYGYRFNCTGSESSLCDCVYIENSCSSMEVVQITCYASENGTIRLTNGENGLLQVFYDGEWGYVCDDGWTPLNSNVTCDILGYDYAVSTTISFYDDNTNYLLNLIDCVGNEAAFLDCLYSVYTPGTCFSNEHIYITCLHDGAATVVLNVFSYIFVSISFISLIISLILFCIAGKAFFKVETNIIYFNYCIAMLLATGIFLFGIDRGKFNRIACMIIAFILHYTWLAVFTWTLCIGLLVMIKFVINVMSTRKIYPYLIVFGWVFPLVIPIITISITHSYYVNESEHCFLNNDNGVIWALIAPIIIIVIINAVLLVIAIIKIIYTKRSNQNNEHKDIMKDALITALILTPVLGIPWLFLLLNISIRHIALQYIFIFLNGLIGLVFLLVIVLRNKEVHGILKSGKTIAGLRRLMSTDTKTSENQDYESYNTPVTSVDA